MSLGFGGANAAVVLALTGEETWRRRSSSPASAPWWVPVRVGEPGGRAEGGRVPTVGGSQRRLPRRSRARGAHRTASISRVGDPAAGRRMSPPSRFAVAAARMALEDAGSSPNAQGRAVVMSIAFGPAAFTEGILRQILTEGPESASPSSLHRSRGERPGRAESRSRAGEGTEPDHRPAAKREPSPPSAAARPRSPTGAPSRALVGGVEEMPPLAPRAARSLRRAGAAGRPTAAKRRGPSIDAAAVSSPPRAPWSSCSSGRIARGNAARPCAPRIRGFGGAFDASAPRVGWGGGQPLSARPRAHARARRRRPARDRGRIVSGASGSVGGDRLEARTLRAVWGDDRPPPVLAPKASDRRVRRRLPGGGASLAAPSGLVRPRRAGFRARSRARRDPHTRAGRCHRPRSRW